MGQNPTRTQIFTDLPAEIDQLGFENYAKVISNVIMDQETRTPITIGIHGSWGSGKTSLMKMIAKRLDESKVKQVWFDVWRFQDEEIVWTALLITILEYIKNEQSGIRESLEKLSDLMKKTGDIAKRSIISKVTGLRDPLKAEVDSFDYSQHVETINKLKEDFEKAVNTLLGDRERLVIFIDDLDRCKPEKCLEILEGMKLFLETKRCIFVIGADIEHVSSAISHVYGESGLIIDGSSYLEKMIQIPFNIPPSDTKKIEEFLEDKLVVDVDKDIVVSGFGRNPRKLKRFMNLLQIQLRIVEEIGKDASFDNNLLAKLLIIQSRWRQFFNKITKYPRCLINIQENLRDKPKQSIEEFEGLKEQEELRGLLLVDPPFPDDESLVRYIFLTGLTLIEASRDENSLSKIDEMIPKELLSLKPHTVTVSWKFNQRIQLLAKDIIYLNVDAIVNLTDIQLNMIGQISKRIVNLGGPAIEKELDNFLSSPEKVEKLKLSDIVVTKGGNLRAKYVFHAVLPGRLMQRGLGISSADIFHTTQNLLKKAKEYRLRSIAIPALVIGYSDDSLLKSAQSMIRGVSSFFRKEDIQLKVVIVVLSEELYKTFQEELINQEETLKKLE